MGRPDSGGPRVARIALVQMPKNHWIAYFWPGLPQLWSRGSWAGLLVAVGFTALLNVLLLATLVFGEWLTLDTRLIVGGALVTVWLLARWQSRAERRANGIGAATNTRTGARAGTGDQGDEQAASGRHVGQVAEERDQLFREAQGHYVRNDWVATEQVLLRLLKQDARDVESRLMLATLWRHQQRSSEALRQLDRIDRLEAASMWQHEIAAERMAIADANAEHEERHEDEKQADDNREDAQSGVPPERHDQQPTENHEHRDDDQQCDDQPWDDHWDQRRAA